MKLTMNSVAASSQRTKTFEKRVAGPEGTCEATSVAQPCVIFRFEDHAIPRVDTPAKHTAIKDLVGSWSKNEQRRAALEQARKWVADSFHGGDGDTVRTLRLRKGWSQARLAADLGTSQSHVARIERGTENLSIETCRRLCVALGINMNTLDEALRRQESLAASKAT
jgi:ribosome-binding protein aMBF1 (putative translation factor)